MSMKCVCVNNNAGKSKYSIWLSYYIFMTHSTHLGLPVNSGGSRKFMMGMEEIMW